ncbi:MAG: hypothetical protein IKU93_03500, partial [Alistipes sp.]|nr:hypothetical protein [Alistipes sp.]
MKKRISPTGLNRYSGDVPDIKMFADCFRSRVKVVPEELDDATVANHKITRSYEKVFLFGDTIRNRIGNHFVQQTQYRD